MLGSWDKESNQLQENISANSVLIQAPNPDIYLVRSFGDSVCLGAKTMDGSIW
jgi:hypothetical protein